MTDLDYFTLKMKVKILSFVSLSEKKTPEAEEKEDYPSVPFQTSDLIKFLKRKKIQ